MMAGSEVVGEGNIIGSSTGGGSERLVRRPSPDGSRFCAGAGGDRGGGVAGDRSKLGSFCTVALAGLCGGSSRRVRSDAKMPYLRELWDDAAFPVAVGGPAGKLGVAKVGFALFLC